MTEIKIYNFSNEEKIIKIPDKPIDHIYVEVTSGDEVGCIAFEDGETMSFDASPADRMMDFYDGSYTVEKNEIEKWAKMAQKAKGTISYDRLFEFE